MTKSATHQSKTPTKQAGAKRWLWTAATTTAAFFVIHVHCGTRGLQALLGDAIAGVVISDRWWGYNRLPLEQRQICWAHLKRDFQKCKERGGEGKIVGDLGLLVQEDVFTLWWEFREGLIYREKFQRQLEPLVAELRVKLEIGARFGLRLPESVVILRQSVGIVSSIVALRGGLGS